MKQFVHVLKFELNNFFKNKSFIMVTLILAIVAAGAVAVPGIIGSLSKGNEAADEKVAAIYSASGDALNIEELKGKIESYSLEVYDTADEVREAVGKGTVAAGFLVEAPLSYIYVVENRSFDSLQGEFEDALKQQYQETYLKQQGLTEGEIEKLYQTEIKSDTEIFGKDSVSNFAYTYMLVFVLYFLVLFYGQMIATSVTTEKSNRAIEILVTSVNTNSLIFGKVLAGAISGVVQTGLILGSAVVAYGFCRDAWDGKLDMLFQIPAAVWAAFIFFGMAGYLLYAFIFGMLGALVSKTEDISKVSSPVMMLYMASFMIAMFSIQNSDGMLIKICSFIPFTASNSMLIRVAMGTVQPWEILIAGGLLVISCVLIAILAGKIFRFGTLLYGNPIKFRNALKNLKNQR